MLTLTLDVCSICEQCGRLGLVSTLLVFGALSCAWATKPQFTTYMYLL